MKKILGQLIIVSVLLTAAPTAQAQQAYALEAAQRAQLLEYIAALQEIVNILRVRLSELREKQSEPVTPKAAQPEDDEEETVTSNEPNYISGGGEFTIDEDGNITDSQN